MIRPLAAVFPLLLATVAAQTPAIEWHTDFAEARQLAGERHAPLFVVFRCER